MNAIERIIKSLESLFTETDANFITRQQNWAKSRQESLKEFEANYWATPRTQRNDLYGDSFCKECFALSGGKTWYNVFKYNSAENVAKIVDKKCRQTIEARNESIAKKLAKAEITQVISDEISRTSDGFHGRFVVITDRGKKIIEIETILAGGYNVQCLHCRTLVKVKKG